MRAWGNGRRACLRGKWETVWVQVPSPAPEKINPSRQGEDYFFILTSYKRLPFRHIIGFPKILIFGIKEQTCKIAKLFSTTLQTY